MEEDLTTHPSLVSRFIGEVKDFAIFMLDTQGRIVTWNAGARNIFGHEAAEALGADIALLYPEEAIARGEHARELHAATIHGKCDEESWRVRKDGTRFWANGALTALHDDDRKLTGFCKITRDLTERKLASDAIRNKEALLQSVVNVAIDGIITIDQRGIIISFNPAAQAIFGYDAAEVIGNNISLLMPEPHKSEHDDYLDRYLKTGEAKVIGIGREVVGLRKDGSTFPLDLAIAEFQLNGESHFTGIVRDMTQTKQAEQKFRYEKAFSETLLESLPGVVFLLDVEGHLLRWNRTTEEITGYAADELLRKKALDFFPPDEHEYITKQIALAFSEGRSTTEGHLVGKNGKRTPFFFNGVRLDMENGVYCVGIGIDISQRKSLEDQLRQSQRLEAIGQLAGGVAHDFNNLLTIISGYSDILLRTMKPGDPAQSAVQAIHDAGERAASLTKQLLAFSRKTMLVTEVLDMNKLIRETEKMLRRLIGEDVQLKTNLDDTIKPVRLDPGQFGQILMNLAVNARDAMPRGGSLTIETHPAAIDDDYCRSHPDAILGDFVCLVMTDSGIGMTEDVKCRIFEPFFTTKGAARGTGLGLSVVHGILKQSGGFLEVDSEVGQGTSFRLYFPAEKSAKEARAGSHESAAEIPRGSESVLLVEDEPRVRSFAAISLQTLGYTVVTANSGTDALEIASKRDSPFDLLVTDVIMPGMSGRELADEMCVRFPSLKTLFMSGYTDDAVIRHGLVAEEVAFIQKPFSPIALARKVRNVLDAR